MSRSVLLQLARDSIQEVLESARTINKRKLLDEHPLLNDKIATTVNIYLDSKLRGSSSTKIPSFSLLEDIIRNAKIAAFEDKNFTPLTTSEYLHSEIELIITTQEGIMSEKDPSILRNKTPLPNDASE
ncbi:MAG: AMMECR1 domain-containing protein [Sulfurimonas sp. RIFOXYD12_FULL_33_39]|uniref:AMMECR1 domain-containing protein n=1 Tax=unclassified Sulfurimonas TaxID=2623549 RepID=UPI0008BA9E27|nr:MULTISPECIES: AMMECR1 domain-containing protein [unclassified Sulfurimonas]OHE02765.1 MAG: AMMECR1 domain-containing protein [Sulfurimonas sp. RIFCSPLOWO2_12_FULL_34_6]OHE10722.1 MAG: AMMECR1 domain-containing protein [Sulfurimonas sp. RIFOXYD12_FULL_33_39]OHE13508.1 MAG: AMMECR1 domain-containing protein [Sulfurimonas sp. RIFOXYD2_FULL_34_21]